MLNKLKNAGLSVGKTAAIVLTVVIVLFVLLSFLRFGFVYWIYSTVENWTTVRLGFDYYLSNLIATTFAAIFSLLMPMLAWYIFLGKKRAWGIGTTIGIQLLICVSVYTVGSGVCFDRRTGAPLCYFADTAKGRVWSYTPGFDPASGKPFRLYTREIKDDEDRRKNSSKSGETPASPSVNKSPALTLSDIKTSVAPETYSPPSVAAPDAPSSRKPEKIVVQTESQNRRENNERQTESEERRRTEETRLQQIADAKRREDEENRRREDENNRINAERERFERQQKTER